MSMGWHTSAVQVAVVQLLRAHAWMPASSDALLFAD